MHCVPLDPGKHFFISHAYHGVIQMNWMFVGKFPLIESNGRINSS